jgi:tetratricopeptide (TPR) repeat protein
VFFEMGLLGATMNRLALAVLFAAAVTGASYGQTRDQNIARCSGSDNPDLRIGACTTLIQSGQENTQHMSIGFNNRGFGYYDKGQFDLAIADYNRAIKLNPNYAIAYNGRGNAYYGKGRYDLAIADYNRAIKLNPNFAYAYNDRGTVYSDKGQNDLAIADYNRAIKLNPNFAIAYNGRGTVYDDKGQYDLAIADYNRAIKLNPGYANAYYDRGNAYRSKGQYDLAIADYNRAIKVNPNFAIAYRSRGTYHFYLGQFPLATTDFADSLSHNPADTYSALWLYVTRVKLGTAGKDELARNAAKLDLAKWPGPIAQFYLGKATTEQVNAAAAQGDASTKVDQTCETAFFIGEYELRKKNAAGRTQLQAAADLCPHISVQYNAAIAELARLK